MCYFSTKDDWFSYDSQCYLNYIFQSFTKGFAAGERALDDQFVSKTTSVCTTQSFVGIAVMSYVQSNLRHGEAV